jgi:hypothetical protein
MPKEDVRAGLLITEPVNCIFSNVLESDLQMRNIEIRFVHMYADKTVVYVHKYAYKTVVYTVLYVTTCTRYRTYMST